MRYSTIICATTFSLLAFGAAAQSVQNQGSMLGSAPSWPDTNTGYHPIEGSQVHTSSAPSWPDTNTGYHAMPEYTATVGQSANALVDGPGGNLQSLNSLPNGWNEQATPGTSHRGIGYAGTAGANRNE